ncbi:MULTISPECIES: aldo/keto reductase [Protofrankia]|uniref:Aldo/keto reductase n=1 Tax=Candidatus Protofrankia datiscae TaxID=2716812 RepID=F8B6J4_9ACTN|nr:MULTISPECIES: aldo/keto reductase [Protofrankia]AEH09297.1 aldo/keto reductase [Candidatus Protofrankia datiscae]
MRYRRFGRLGWQVSEVGMGMWGMGGGVQGWTGALDDEKIDALQRAVDLGCTFFDTAWIYGRGHSEQLLGQLVRANPDRRLYVATKVPPKDLAWPSTRKSRLEDVFPADHIEEYVGRSLDNLGLGSIDLLQMHVWEDSWAMDERWQRPLLSLKEQGVVKAVGISVNRWEPWNVLRTLETGLADAVQVIFNIFDQSPRDALFPAAAEHDIAIIARVPFDEGTLTGRLTRDTRWPEGDWRNSYFVPENLEASVERAERLRQDIPSGMSMAQAALRFILADPAVSTVIPGMRRIRHVEENIAVSDAPPPTPELLDRWRRHRWDRTPTWWSQ